MFRLIFCLIFIACGDNIRPPDVVECDGKHCMFIDAQLPNPNCGGDPCRTIDAGVADAPVDAPADADTCEGDPQPEHGKEPCHAHKCDTLE